MSLNGLKMSLEMTPLEKWDLTVELYLILELYVTTESYYIMVDQCSICPNTPTHPHTHTYTCTLFYRVLTAYVAVCPLKVWFL